MAKLSSWTNRTVTVTIDLDGTPVTLTVRPNLMTPERELALREATGREGVAEVIRFFCEYVQAWDITDDDDVMVPLDPEVITTNFPGNLLRQILTESSDKVAEQGN